MKKYHQYIVSAIAICLILMFILFRPPSFGIKSMESQKDFEATIANNEFIYISQESCTDCKAFKAKLNEAVKATDVIVYEYVIDDFRGQENHIANLIFLEVMGTPQLVKITDGKVIQSDLFSGSSITDIEEFLKD